MSTELSKKVEKGSVVGFIQKRFGLSPKDKKQEDTRQEKDFEELEDLMSQETAALNIVIGQYLEGLNNKEKIEKSELLALIASKEAKNEIINYLDFIDILNEAREAAVGSERKEAAGG